MKEAPAFTLPYSVGKAALSNNIDKYIGKTTKTKFQIFIEKAFGLWCCIMLVAIIKETLKVEDNFFYILSFNLWVMFLWDYVFFNQHMSRL